jgi:hypothetical protein
MTCPADCWHTLAALLQYQGLNDGLDLLNFEVQMQILGEISSVFSTNDV